MVHEPLTEEQRTQHQMLFWRTMAEIVSIQSPALHLSQLRQAFINSYFSMGIINSNRQHFNMFYWMAPQSPAMDAARDAFCMIHLGSRHRDQQLITAGLLRHVAAIRWLRGDIGKPTALTDDSVLGAAYTLGQTEIFTAVSHGGQGWQQHMDGVYDIFQRRGPDSMTSPFAEALLQNTRPLAVMHGLLKRRSTFFSSPSWIAVANKTPTLATKLTNLALKIAPLLRKADDLHVSKRPKQAHTVHS
ncbi:hypothetical protein LTR37_001767 [Vermiconidia calcicola]|uniref:Uncharacterized protein n=1 Tax=Vermiconidia calcicola TaxID=1690605 RepID=A0ACC3NV67_9PEZI|nr:hypothetical protein LTR37_001767 [Vermiconidia calcicola]